ncbi:MAG: serine/threonine protein kinase [Deltaproteobacteria bacterium]|nr:serine/threonine protein kinase [Deltaproteobacteria bacterium]
MAEPHKKLKLTIGDVVADRYRIDGVVGRGGFGAVYQATQLDSGLGVALKVLLKNFSSGKKDSKRFQREAALVQQLRHPNVVALLDYGATRQGKPFIAFELLAGESLSAVLKERGPMPLERVVQITRGVLHALYAAHTLGIIHRDIKPGNVFLCDDGDGIKVLDFGIAKAVSGEQANVTQLTEAGQMIGTPQYMAPEQVRGTGVYPATDLYALGLVMSEMLTGKKVVQSPALLDVYMQHIDDRPFELPPLVRESPVGPIVQRAVAKVLDLRYGTATEMSADLDAAVPPPASVEPLSARTIEMPSRPGLLDPLETTAPLTDESEPALDDQWATAMAGKPLGTVVMDRPERLDRADPFEAMPDSSAAETADRHSGPEPLALASGELAGPEAQATRDSWPVWPVPGGPPAASAVPSSPALNGPAPSYPGAVGHPGAGQLAAGHPGSGETFGLHEQTYGEDDYGPDSRAHFRSGLLIVLIVFVLAAVIMALVWWAPWDDASAPAQPSDWRLATGVASAPAPARVRWGALLATCRFC